MKKALTFDDVLIVPASSSVLPNEVNIKTQLTKNINLNIPIITAAMDTVTESNMAISVARHGGIGVIHKNLSIEDQSREVDIVKRSESGMIMNPVTIHSNASLHEALNIMEKYSISGIPVVDQKVLVGIITNRDIRFATNLNSKVKNSMTSEKLVTVSPGTTLEEAKKVLQKFKIEKLLVVDSKGSLTGLITVKDILKKENYPNEAIDKHGRLLVAAAVGITDDVIDRVSSLVDRSVDAIVVDTAHGHSKGVATVVSKIKNKFENLDVIAGNVATLDGMKSLVDAGADAVKVGIGAGSTCTTRVIAGIGVPQLTAVLDCRDYALKNGISIISDGGMRYSGDVAKSLAAGASVVMLGNMFAGTDESPGEIVLWQGRSYKSYRGMGSIPAMKQGSSDRYFQKYELNSKLVPEGIEGMVPYKGKLSNVIFQLVGGLRSSMGYTGSKNIKEFQEKAEFVEITNSGSRESHPHDINITKESPNYQKPDNRN